MPVGLTHVWCSIFLTFFPHRSNPFHSSALTFYSPLLTVFNFPPLFTPLSLSSLVMITLLSLLLFSFPSLIISLPLSSSSHPGSSFGGHDESPGDHAATDAADPSAAGALPSAAPGPAPAAAGCYATAGTHTHAHAHAHTLMRTHRDKYSDTNPLPHADAHTPWCKLTNADWSGCTNRNGTAV